jgi:hypothetical protein
MSTQITRPAESALMPYCGRLHRIIDGLPVAHRCRILPTDSITAAINGDFEGAVSLMARAAAKGPLNGIWADQVPKKDPRGTPTAARLRHMRHRGK